MTAVIKNKIKIMQPKIKIEVLTAMYIMDLLNISIMNLIFYGRLRTFLNQSLSKDD